MCRNPGILCLILALCAPAAFAVEETLQNDNFVSGAAATFQGGFVPGEIAAARFEPQIACPCVVETLTVLFGGSPGVEIMGISVWDDTAGSDAPGDLLFAGDVTLTGSNVNLQVIDLTVSPVIVDGPFRIGLTFNHGGLPSVATDTDGTIDAAQNFILADLGGVSFWFRSATLGVGGDFIFRATIDNFVAADSDQDGVPDEFDNCTNVLNAPQRDTDGDNYGNACDADFNNDCVVNAVDLGLLRVAFFSTDGEPNWNPNADINGDGVVNVVDLGTLRSVFFQAPGPSGTTDECASP